MEQTFPAETARNVDIQQIKGAVTVYGWEEPTIQFRSNDEPNRLEIMDGTLLVYRCDSNIELAVPYGYSIAGMNIDSNVKIEHVYAVSLSQVNGNAAINTIQGNVELGTIKGATSLTNVAGEILIDQIKNNLFISQSGNVSITGKAHGNVAVEHVGRVIVTSTAHNLTIKESGEVMIQHVGHNLEAEQVASLQCQHVGNSCKISGGNEATILLKSVGNDLQVSGIANLKINHVGNRLKAQDIQGNLETKHIGNSLTATGIGGSLTVGHIGGSATVSGVQGNLTINTVGSHLTLERIPAPERTVRARAGNDIHIAFPDQANATLYAQAGHAILGTNVEIPRAIPHDTATFVYGNGSATVWLMAGRDISIQSQETPQSVESGFYQKQWNEWWENLAERFADIENEWPTTFPDMATTGNTSHFGYGDDNYQWKQAERQQKAEQRTKRAQERRERGRNARYYKRDWYASPEHINAILDKAQQAALDGIEGAQEAVEQAIQNLHIHYKDAAPFPFFTDMPGKPGEKQKRTDDASEAGAIVSGVALHPQTDREQEREAILRMIAEGRITPAEGDMLLGALDD